MASTLMFAHVANFGVKAYEVPCGCLVNFMQPFDDDFFSQWDITSDTPKIKELMKNMSIQDVRNLLVEVGADPETIPPRMKKDSLISRFVLAVAMTNETVQQARLSSLASSSTMAGIPQDEPFTTVASTKPFSGQGYKMTEEGFDAEMDDYTKKHEKPDLSVAVLPYENAPKELATVPEEQRDFYVVEMTEKNEKTMGTAFIKLECQNATFRFVYHYSITDKVDDILELVELNTSLERKCMTLYYKDGNSYMQGWEPIYASVSQNNSLPDFRLCIRLSGGAKTAVRKQVEKNEKVKMASLKFVEKQKKIEISDVKHLPIIKDVEETLGKFMNDIEKDSVGTLKFFVEKMDITSIEEALSILNATTGVEVKLNKIACLVLGGSTTKVSKMLLNMNSIVLAVNAGFHYGIDKCKADESTFNLGHFAKMLDQALNRKIGAKSSSADVAMDADL